jgi:hypothetical protein
VGNFSPRYLISREENDFCIADLHVSSFTLFLLGDRLLQQVGQTAQGSASLRNVWLLVLSLICYISGARRFLFFCLIALGFINYGCRPCSSEGLHVPAFGLLFLYALDLAVLWDLKVRDIGWLPLSYRCQGMPFSASRQQFFLRSMP